MKLIAASFVSIALLFTACTNTQKKESSSEQKVKARTYTLTMATTWGPTLSPLIDSAQNMAKYAQTLSNGRLKIRVDASNKHKSPLGIFDMVKGGQYDLGHTASYYWKGKDIVTMAYTSMPFGMTTPELYAWFYEGGGLELMQKTYAKYGMLSFPGGNTGVQMGGWFKKQINTLEDLEGLKMRIPGFAGEIMSKLGVQVTNISAGELYTALDRNTIDALEWVGPSMDINMGFHKIAPYYYTGWHEPASETQFLINKKVFEKLPKDLQEILKISIKTAAYDMYIQNYDMNAKALKLMKEQYPNIQIKTFPKEVMDEMKKANKDLRQQLGEKSDELKQVLLHQEAYLKDVRQWTEISDYLYIKNNIEK